MKHVYTAYIDSLRRIGRSLAGRCEPVRDSMMETFPELHSAQGWVMDGVDHKWHYWSVTDDDEVVDPTASQFKNILWYEEADPSELWEEIGLDQDKGPARRCLNCGVWTQNGSFCSSTCASDLKLHVTLSDEDWDRLES